MALEPGSAAPDFNLTAADGTPLNLASFTGKKLVLYFYPKADTSGCTKQAIGFTEAMDLFTAKGAVVVGVSKDPPSKLEKFHDKYDLRVTLASDPEGAACEAYGVWVEKSMYGKTYMGIERSTFVISPDGTVAHALRKVKVPGHAEAVLKLL